MSTQYEAHGVRFQYPENWELAQQIEGQDVFITVSNNGSSFWSLSLFPNCPEAADILESALEAFREEYEELDEYSTETTLCGLETLACELEFVCLELINSGFIRVFVTPKFTALVLYQGSDHELAETHDLLEAISSSLVCDFDFESDSDSDTGFDSMEHID
jgi:hypothetical protein